MQVSAHASLGMIYIVFPCLGMSYSSKIRPVLYDASILPIYRGIVVICSNKVAMEKMAIIITFAPALTLSQTSPGFYVSAVHVF